MYIPLYTPIYKYRGVTHTHTLADTRHPLQAVLVCTGLSWRQLLPTSLPIRRSNQRAPPAPAPMTSPAQRHCGQAAILTADRPWRGAGDRGVGAQGTPAERTQARSAAAGRARVALAQLGAEAPEELPVAMQLGLPPAVEATGLLEATVDDKRPVQHHKVEAGHVQLACLGGGDMVTRSTHGTPPDPTAPTDAL